MILELSKGRQMLTPDWLAVYLTMQSCHTHKTHVLKQSRVLAYVLQHPHVRSELRNLSVVDSGSLHLTDAALKLAVDNIPVILGHQCPLLCC